MSLSRFRNIASAVQRGSRQIQSGSTTPVRRSRAQLLTGLPGIDKNNFRYPLEHQGNSQDYLKIKIFKYDTSGRSAINSQYSGIARSSEEILATVILPIPEGLGDTNAVTWGDDQLTPLASGVASAAGNAMGGDVQSLQEQWQSMASADIDQETKDKINSYLAGMAANTITNVNPQSLMTRATGSIIHTNLELLFRGVNLRRFSFNWNFAPRNLTESTEVKHIIRLLKQSMSPSDGSAPGVGGGGTGGWFLESPCVYQLQYMKGGSRHPFLHAFKPCAMTDISVNYAASGMHATYDDGTPVHMTMSCSFSELNPIYNEDYDHAESAGTGVGF